MISFALIDVLIPDGTSYIFYSLVKSQLWVVLSVVGYVEIFDTSLPDASMRTYLMAYGLGTIVPPILTVIQYFGDYTTSVAGNIFYHLSPVMTVIFVYGTEVCFIRRDIHQTNPQEITENFDTFAPAVLDIDVIGLESSNGDALTMVLRKLASKDFVYCFYVRILETLPLLNWPKRAGVSVGIVKPGARFQQWKLVSTFLILYNINDVLLMFLTREILAAITDPLHVVGYYTVFVIVNAIFRLAIKRIGLQADANKEGTVSLWVIGEAICLMLYYTAYRTLFTGVKSIKIFFMLEALHFAMEWFLYVVRVSKTFLGLLPRQMRPLFERNGFTLDDWRLFAATDFTIRIGVFIISALGIIILYTTAAEVPGAVYGLRQYHSWTQPVEFVSFALGLELVNAVGIVTCMTRVMHIKFPFFKSVLAYLQNRNFSFIVVAMFTITLINPLMSDQMNNTMPLLWAEDDH